jgi:phosphoribosylformimino-5-aminoimidazole carboxamide ribotide isomerase
MLLIPAIDLRNGACVRLEQGDFSRDTRYADDPLEVARSFAAHGARRLHLVDLDGARDGQPRHLELLRAVTAETGLLVEFGGGMRSLETVEAALQAGAARVVLGTAALEDPDLLRRACAAYGTRIVAGVDARDGMVATRGWLATSVMPALDLARRAVDAGCGRIIYTDIATDGMLRGPNLQAVREMIATVGVPIVASGGVATEEHLRALAETGAEAVIVGKALYSGDLPLSVIEAWQ